MSVCAAAKNRRKAAIGRRVGKDGSRKVRGKIERVYVPVKRK
jgi:hypothetical protein